MDRRVSRQLPGRRTRTRGAQDAARGRTGLSVYLPSFQRYRHRHHHGVGRVDHRVQPRSDRRCTTRPWVLTGNPIRCSFKGPVGTDGGQASGTPLRCPAPPTASRCVVSPGASAVNCGGGSYPPHGIDRPHIGQPPGARTHQVDRGIPGVERERCRAAQRSMMTQNLRLTSDDARSLRADPPKRAGRPQSA